MRGGEVSATGKVLVLVAHPAALGSRVSRALRRAASDLGDVTIHDLYRSYPDFDIDVRQEQQQLRDNHTIVLQFPFYWYSTPALLKEWLDLVLEDWARGGESTGCSSALRGKRLLCAVTTGGRARGQSKLRSINSGLTNTTVRELLAPLVQAAALCRMTYLPPFIVYDSDDLSESELREHSSRYVEALVGLRDGVQPPTRRIAAQPEPAQVDAVA